MYVSWDHDNQFTTWIGKRPRWYKGDMSAGYWPEWTGTYSEASIERLTGFHRPKLPTLWEVTEKGVEKLEEIKP